MFDYEKENDNAENKKDDEKQEKIILKILQIIIGVIMAAFHI